ncbi:putative F-box/LRR-repeat protein 23 [Vicia villosa]|uniref:putative F-box/LRR-repeat protein 23 n=1 Tax=Vicia villosa TaxID=3911 RepID=UPI00273CBA97|nr:putative F-box/LRR-repeat protein 23 [Vicia villosa]
MAYSSIPSTETIVGPNWLELPRDVTANILQRLGTFELLTRACQVCPLWWNICKDPHMWRTIKMTMLFSSRYHRKNQLVKVCRKAIERSCGQLEDIDIERFATDDLLAYIADSALHLRHMRIAMTWALSNKGFIESFEKLPYLESLDISFNIRLSKKSFEVVGRCCPLLKTLKCSMTKTILSDVDYDDSFAIAKTMPGLRHLKISGQMPISEGLSAILDGCPLLESLDLKDCYYFRFEYTENLEKMCREKIKDFQPPENCYSSDHDSD